MGELGERLRDAAAMSSRAAGLLDAAAHEVTRELRHFRDWEKESAGDLTAEERAFLLHDYLDSGRGDLLATALQKMRTAVDTLDSGLRTVIEELGDHPLRAARRLRWAAAATPPAGPESIVRTGSMQAVATPIAPPFDCKTRKRLAPDAVASADTCWATTGCT